MQSISYIVSPAAAAALYSIWELNAIITIDVVGAAIACLTVWLVHIPELEPKEQSANTSMISFGKPAMLMSASIMLMGTSMAVSGLLAPTAFVLFVICCAAMGLSVPFYSGVQTALFQQKVRPEYLGRVFSLTGSVMSLAMPIGLILSGMFADRIGVNTWFLLSRIATIAIAILFYLIPSIRAFDNEVPLEHSRVTISE